MVKALCVAAPPSDTRNVRFGSKADICASKGHVCFTFESGHVQCTSSCLLWAKSGHSPSAPRDSFSSLPNTGSLGGTAIPAPRSCEKIEGSCHCGNLRFTFEWPTHGSVIPVRSVHETQSCLDFPSTRSL